MSDTERVLLVGGGGREHAIARAISQSPRDPELYAAASNRNPGIDALADGFEALDETDADAVTEYAEAVDATVAMVGPETPLAAGVVDALEDIGLYAFSPKQTDARIETDKAFQREFMAEHDIPGTPDFAVFDNPWEAAEYVREYDGDVAVKPTGLTGGKGVKVTGDQVSKDESVEYIHDADHDKWVIEERLIGEEFTLQAFVANGSVRTTPAVQDHKRAFEGDEGPNTGGMGSYSDATRTLPFMTDEDYDDAVDVIDATVEALPEYRGVLYGQFMLTADGPKVVEFNARFGDPEAMNTLPVLETDFLDVLTSARDGEALPELDFADQATVCKYAVPAGYPSDPVEGAKVTVDAESVARAAGRATATSSGEEPRDSIGDALLFYASVDARDDGIYTTTSRSFAVVGVAATITEAEKRAEAALSGVDEGFHMRLDIGKPDLVQQRIDHMHQIRGE